MKTLHLLALVQAQSLAHSLKTPLGVEPCYRVIAVHKASLGEGGKRQRGSNSWVCLSLCISAGRMGITQNQLLCK